jgi:hypothetical protein
VRIANENRIRQLTRDEVDKDGAERGFGLSPEHPDVMALAVIVRVLEQQEHQAVLNLQRKVRKHPLYPWVKTNRGVGEKQAARLLAAIGDPYINSAKGEPRTVSALWAYCGLHVLPASQGLRDTHKGARWPGSAPADHTEVEVHHGFVGGVQHGDSRRPPDDRPSSGVAAKRRKGERANWSTRAKMRAYLIAESCMKLGKCSQCRGGQSATDGHYKSAASACDCSAYRKVYERRRAHTATTHPEWTDGHSHNDALRVVSKEILKDLWRAARDWHNPE